MSRPRALDDAILRRAEAEIYVPDVPTPDDLKALAAEIRRRYKVPCQVVDVLALSRQHDPFYVFEDGARDAAARWFVDTVWPLAVGRFVTADGIHLRRLHYFLGTTGAPGIDGSPYKLTTDRGVLSDASSAARSLGLLPDVRLVDRRHRDALNHLAPMREPPEPTTWVDDPSIVSLERITVPFDWLTSRVSTPELYGYDWSNADESTALYLVVEKSTVDDVLAPTCAALGITYVPLVGLSSNIIVEALADRIAEDRRTARIAYIADLDPGGGIMPRHVSRGFEHLAATERLLVPVAVDRLALTWAQVEKFDIPFADTDADDRRPWGHEGRIELDALVALAPAGTLQSIVRRWAKPYRTTSLRDDRAAAEAEAEADVADAWDDHTVTFRRRLERLDSIRRRLIARHTATFAALDAYNSDAERVNRLVERLRDEYVDLAADFDPTLPDRPLPEEIDDDTSDWLYSSERTYMEQLVAYREHDIAASRDDAE